jgi:hypothetical protein
VNWPAPTRLSNFFSKRGFVRRPDVLIDSFAGLLTQFKANGMSGFVLADGCPIGCHIVRCRVLDRDADDISL